jgi:xylulokinase
VNSVVKFIMLLTADIGTTSLKAALIDLDGKLKAFSRFAYPMGSAAAVWEKAFERVLEDLHSALPGAKIDGICISGNGPTLVPVNREGDALQPLYWFEDAEKTTAKSLFLPHVVSFREKSPSQYENTALFFSSHEWLAYRLGADAVTALPQEEYIPYYWDEEQCALFCFDIKKFLPFVKMGSPAGKVSAAAAGLYGSLGLKSGIPIIVGAPDFISALIGTGVLKGGDVCDRAGSSEGINFCAHSNESAEVINLRILPHVKKGLCNISSLIPVSGRLFESYRICTNQESRSYEALLAELIPSEQVPAEFDTRLFQDDLSFPSKLNSALAALQGIHGDKTAIGRSVLCAIGFSVRHAVETLESQGFQVKTMKVSGGQGKNPLWNQLKYDISGVSLLIQ